MKKKVVGVLIVLVLAAVGFGTLSPAIADEGVGEWASDAGHFGKGKILPPGQYGIIAQRLNEILSTGAGLGTPRHLMAATLTDGINDPNTADEISDFFIVDVRTTAEYCASTVPGAVHIPLASVATPDALARFPRHMPILFICNTGHQATSAMVVLNALGYDAYTLRFGMSGWRGITRVRTWSPKAEHFQVLTGPNLPVQSCQ